MEMMIATLTGMFYGRPDGPSYANALRCSMEIIERRIPNLEACLRRHEIQPDEDLVNKVRWLLNHFEHVWELTRVLGARGRGGAGPGADVGGAKRGRG